MSCSILPDQLRNRCHVLFCQISSGIDVMFYFAESAQEWIGSISQTSKLRANTSEA